jgi:hypothetical protein
LQVNLIILGFSDGWFQTHLHHNPLGVAYLG